MRILKNVMSENFLVTLLSRDRKDKYGEKEARDLMGLNIKSTLHMASNVTELEG